MNSAGATSNKIEKVLRGGVGGIKPRSRPTAAYRWRVKRASNWSVRHTVDSARAINQSIS